MAGRLGRVEPRRQARAYLLGLPAPIERKNGWRVAEAAGDAAPDRMQRLSNSARQDPRQVRADLRDYVTGHLGHRDGVLIVDETGWPSRRHRSARLRLTDAGRNV
uniref:transposase n=1 Tax=Acrocarpospora phusangensis TaxID=1070424 RepID=UPI0035A253F5